ncbi:hypothetical protein sscle_11g085450 [Sclerotinia sclerotiorum 1980 UF-70]|uniref:Uncharacterized protein n=1 Tax=Sclerotinia sclerotiorum (strain ATCC 18683 / 1980 / Ss-1) TaxID=665079 RepID=A0A1D9QFR5_SCLS1|nr:hypothetical protein sscle_11g085450 [Sclerotinia sclerotiorum 1980 UF-70]
MDITFAAAGPYISPLFTSTSPVDTKLNEKDFAGLIFAIDLVFIVIGPADFITGFEVEFSHDSYIILNSLDGELVAFPSSSTSQQIIPRPESQTRSKEITAKISPTKSTSDEKALENSTTSCFPAKTTANGTPPPYTNSSNFTITRARLTETSSQSSTRSSKRLTVILTFTPFTIVQPKPSGVHQTCSLRWYSQRPFGDTPPFTHPPNFLQEKFPPTFQSAIYIQLQPAYFRPSAPTYHLSALPTTYHSSPILQQSLRKSKEPSSILLLASPSPAYWPTVPQVLSRLDRSHQGLQLKDTKEAIILLVAALLLAGQLTGAGTVSSSTVNYTSTLEPSSTQNISTNKYNFDIG